MKNVLFILVCLTIAKTISNPAWFKIFLFWPIPFTIIGLAVLAVVFQKIETVNRAKYK